MLQELKAKLRKVAIAICFSSLKLQGFVEGVDYAIDPEGRACFSPKAYLCLGQLIDPEILRQMQAEYQFKFLRSTK